MQRIARVIDGVVHEPPIQIPDDMTIEQALGPELGAEYLPCGPEVAEGWVWTGIVFQAPPPPVVDPETLKASLATYAAAKRFAVETGGITVNGQAIRTDRESQAMINGAYNLSLVAPGTIQFKTETSFVALSVDDIKAIAIAVGQHVQAAFAKEAEVAAAINAGTITDAAGIDAAFASVA